MRSLILTLLATFLCSCHSMNPEERALLLTSQEIADDYLAKAHLVIMAGQSNMNGRGSLAEPGYVPRWKSHSTVRIWDNQTDPHSWTLLVPGDNTDHFFNPENTTETWGAEMQFAHLVGAHDINNVYILKMASDASLVFHWPGAEINNTWHPQGNRLFPQAAHALRQAVGALGGWNNIEKVSFFWYQGESEALYPPLTQFYAQHTQEVLDGFAGLVQVPLTFYRVMIHEDTDPIFPNVDQIREMQMYGELPGTLINIDDAPLLPDGVHLNSIGCDMLGTEMFRKWYGDQQSER